MDRREAIRNVALLMGGAISATTMGALFDSCNQSSNPTSNKELFSEAHKTLIAEIAEVIVPATTTPGAKAAGVGPFISMMLNDCYPEKAQKVFVDGLEDVEKRAKTKFNKSFTQISAGQQNELLRTIADETVKLKADDKKKEDDQKAKATASGKEIPKADKPIYFFQIIRELSLLGYFTSETGATQALAYIQVPGRYEGCTDLKPGQKSWAL